MEIGPVIAYEKVLTCPRCHAIYDSEELKKIVPDGCNFGFDIIEYIGNGLFLKYRNGTEIQAELKEKNIQISLSEIGYLGKKFIIYLALAHQEIEKQIRNSLALNGGYILHLDATCDKDSPHLMTALDEITEIVLGNVKLPSENSKKIIPFLKQIQLRYGNPLALVHDMGKGILLSVHTIFPDIPDFVCHFHFLRDIGKDLFGNEYITIKKQLRSHKIRSLLREQLKAMKRIIYNNPDLTKSMNTCSQARFFFQAEEMIEPIITVFLLLTWVLDSPSELDGYGFPFDRKELVFYQRLQKAFFSISNFSIKDQPYLLDVRRGISSVLQDKKLQELIRTVQEKVVIFDQLRTAMKIALPEHNEGLNDNGKNISMKTIKEKVTHFRFSERVKTAVSKGDKSYQKMIEQIDRYWDKLFADPIKVITPTGIETIQPQRTNNIMERFFREIKRNWRKRSGMNSMNKTIKAMLAETPLVRNLERAEYMKILLNNHASLADRFAETDANLVRKKLNNLEKNDGLIPNLLKNIIRLPHFLDKLKKLSNCSPAY